MKKKKSYNVTLCGIIAAISTMCMFFTGVMPLLSYTLPALSGAVLAVIVIEINKKWALLTYVAVSLLSVFLTPDKEAATLFVMFLGYYPILKSTLEKVKFKTLELLLKVLCFNVAIFVSYQLIIKIFGMNELIEEFNTFGRYSMLIFVLLANAAFIMYDYALTGVITVYINVFRDKINKRLK